MGECRYLVRINNGNSARARRPQIAARAAATEAEAMPRGYAGLSA